MFATYLPRVNYLHDAWLHGCYSAAFTVAAELKRRHVMLPKQKLLSKRQLKYLRDRLGSLDKEVMLTYIVKVMDVKEAVHIEYYPSRKDGRNGSQQRN